MYGSPDRLPSAITRLWQMVQGVGLERFELVGQGRLWVLQGTILHLHDSRPVEARYLIECDSGWHTANARIEVHDHHQERTLQIKTEGGHWTANGDPQPQLDGCIDIDLEWSPSTNTLPIRRLNLENGASSGPLVAAWIRFPDLVLEPLAQEYQRVTDRNYRYDSCGGTFTAEISVDEHGLVEEYKGFWKRVLNAGEK